jgi:hypothetical protein
MPTNWKTLVEKENSKTFVLPEGWDSRDTVAEQLECSPEKVNDHLRPAIKAGKVETSVFPVWDSTLKRVIRVTAYRDTSKVAASATAIDLAAVRKLRAEGKTWTEIGAAVGRGAEAVRTAVRRAG